MVMLKRSLSLLIVLMLLSFSLSAKTFNQKDVPKPLKPWVDWVLFDQTERHCPFVFNKFNNKTCAWPTSIELKIKSNRADFSQSWQVFQESWIILPGNIKHWPQNVTIDSKRALVTERNKLPAVLLKKGIYKVKGEFNWKTMPESLHIPSNSALVKLSVNGKRINNPEINQQGQLWLASDIESATKDVESDQLDLSVYRLLDDKIPMRVVTRLDLQVSGVSREVNLGNVLLNEHIPMSLKSRIPALLNSDGELRLQVRPGRWIINITSRASQQNNNVSLNEEVDEDWPKNEVWSFQAQNHLRVVKLEGLTRIDPRQTKIPEQWKKLPAFRISQNESLSLKELRRGDQQPQADKLSLKRNLWLDFDGKGYSVKDEINGVVTQSWRLEANPELELGRVAIDGVPQFITQITDLNNKKNTSSEKANVKNKGVEIRRGALNLVADSRINNDVRNLSATGWLHEFKKVSTVLHLPPGWRIFSASGVDNVPQTWLQKWTLLDLFLVLIISISIARLWSLPWAFFALTTLALIWHESGLVPQFIWLNLLAAIAILKIMPEGKFQKVILWYRNSSVLVLLLMVIPFMVTQVRTGIYPQLEKSWYQAMGEGGATYLADRNNAPVMMEMESDQVVQPRYKKEKSRRDSYSSVISKGLPGYALSQDKRQQAVEEFDPKANVQTGPGLPQWKWNKIYLNWNGPVQKGQEISLVLIPPVVHSILNFLRVIFVAVLCLLFLRTIPNIPVPKVVRRSIPETAKLLLLFGLVPLLIFSSPTIMAKSENLTDVIPPNSILNELKTRLTQAPVCLPGCAQIHSMIVRANKDNIELKLNVHALQKVAIPLPASAKQWLPTKVTVDGRDAKALYRARDGVLWLELNKGRFNVIMSGKARHKKHFQLPLQLKPHFVEAKLKGWSLDGVEENGVPDVQLQLSRKQNTRSSIDEKRQSSENEVLPPFVIIKRHMKLGLDWVVETSVQRISPVGSPVVINVPLLKGESILSEGIRVQNNQAFINMAPRQTYITWRSHLAKTVNIKLTAVNNNFATELWTASVSPIWHLQYEGLPVIQHKNQQGNWSPQWHPWPGEQLILNITRPRGIDGNTLTIDKSKLLVTPGKRLHEAQLDLSLRSSQGGQYSLDLPENSDLQSININGVAQSIRLEGQNLTLPISPGKQQIQIVWRNNKTLGSLFQTPQIDLKQNSVNHAIKVRFAQDRWVLFVGGPRLGPAILIWGVLIVILIFSFALGYIKLTPLNTLAWFLLGIGLSQVSLFMALTVVAWLFILALREKLIQHASDMMFNVIQVGIAVLTFIALNCLFIAIQHGLLGSPDMQVTGNGSSAFTFNWYQDRNNALLPQAWMLSVPTMVYRLLMLAWALWLAFSLLRWLKWGWQQYSINGLWRNVSVKTETATEQTEVKELPKMDKEESSDK